MKNEHLSYVGKNYAKIEADCTFKAGLRDFVRAELFQNLTI